MKDFRKNNLIYIKFILLIFLLIAGCTKDKSTTKDKSNNATSSNNKNNNLDKQQYESEQVDSDEVSINNYLDYYKMKKSEFDEILDKWANKNLFKKEN
mgnify:CR=1 FL=1